MVSSPLRRYVSLSSVRSATTHSGICFDGATSRYSSTRPTTALTAVHCPAELCSLSKRLHQSRRLRCIAHLHRSECLYVGACRLKQAQSFAVYYEGVSRQTCQTCSVAAGTIPNSDAQSLFRARLQRALILPLSAY
jgi:hypothetical protein